MAIQWRKEMVVDEAIIDEDHKFLIDIVNNFEAALNRRVDKITIEDGLKALKHYSLQHFKREEELQRLAQYTFCDAHAHEHKDLIKKLDAIADHYQKSSSATDVVSVSKEISDLLRDWLVKHIIQSDLRMLPFVAKMKAHRQNMPSMKLHN